MVPGSGWRGVEAGEPCRHEGLDIEAFGRHPALDHATLGKIETEHDDFVSDFGGWSIRPIPRHALEIQHLAGGDGIEGEARTVGTVELLVFDVCAGLEGLLFDRPAPLVPDAHRVPGGDPDVGLRSQPASR